jgi:hypothetical protein
MGDRLPILTPSLRPHDIDLMANFGLSPGLESDTRRGQTLTREHNSPKRTRNGSWRCRSSARRSYAPAKTPLAVPAFWSYRRRLQTARACTAVIQEIYTWQTAHLLCGHRREPCCGTGWNGVCCTLKTRDARTNVRDSMCNRSTRKALYKAEDRSRESGPSCSA